VWTYVYISAELRLLLHHPNEKLPTFSGEVGFGRRERGNANALNILGWILLRLQNVSIPNFLFFTTECTEHTESLLMFSL